MSSTWVLHMMRERPVKDCDTIYLPDGTELHIQHIQSQLCLFLSDMKEMAHMTDI